jgi:hypothetical protein
VTLTPKPKPKPNPKPKPTPNLSPTRTLTLAQVTPGDPEAPATGPPEVLYHVPARLPLGPYAPSREPTGTPDWLRKLLPEPAGIMSSPGSNHSSSARLRP